MMTRPKILPGFFASVFVVMSLTGCKVDDRYDLSQLDSEITVKVPPIPIGFIGQFALGDLFALDSPYLRVDAAGDYVLSVDVDPFQCFVTVPPVVDGAAADEIPCDDLSPVLYSLEELPDFLSGDTGIALSEMEVSLDLASEVPADFQLSTSLETLCDGSVLHQYIFGDLPVVSGSSELVLSEMQDLGNLFSPFPNELKISVLKIFISDEERRKAEAGKEYGITCGIRASAPLAFSADSRAGLTLPVDVQVNREETGLKRAVLEMDVVNSIPLDFSVSAYVLDSQGVRSDKVRTDISAPIRGGSLDSPAVTSLTVTLKTDGGLQISGIVVECTASSNESVAGVHLNENQGIKFNNAVLSFPDGIQVQLQ